MSSSARSTPARVAVVGGGLAGLAATVALAESGVAVELYEARRRLGGRAASFRDPASGDVVDQCQHVSMGCCTNLEGFCQRVGIQDLFRRDPTLHFFGPAGDCYNLSATSWAPAPMHLAPALMKLGYLSRGERVGIARAMWRMMREPVADDPAGPTIGRWLRDQGQSPRAIEQFWSVVLVSALSETVDRASLFYARKVFVDGFVMNRNGYIMEVPRAPLDELYGKRLEDWLARHGVRLRLATPVTQVAADDRGTTVTTKDGDNRAFDYAILAVPWDRLDDVCSPEIKQLPELAATRKLESAPITGVHLWFDAEITPLPHAVLIGGLCQWVFRRATTDDNVPENGPTRRESGECYYQVVISALREVAGRDHEGIAREIHDELANIWPAARTARLLRWKIVTERNAVFSPRPGIDGLRPRQQTSIPTLALAGDWTHTGWPATMEGAVRSGYLSAEAALAHLGAPRRLLVPELPPAILSRLLVRATR